MAILQSCSVVSWQCSVMFSVFCSCLGGVAVVFWWCCGVVSLWYLRNDVFSTKLARWSIPTWRQRNETRHFAIGFVCSVDFWLRKTYSFFFFEPETQSDFVFATTSAITAVIFASPEGCIIRRWTIAVQRSDMAAQFLQEFLLDRVGSDKQRFQEREV